MKDLFQSADWKSEKHVPVIEIKTKPEKGKPFKIEVSVGKEIAHPNSTAHHIVWIELYFLPAGEKLPYQVGRVEFSAHGASVEGADTSSVYTGPASYFSLQSDKEGTLLASSYCNIHGLWENKEEMKF